MGIRFTCVSMEICSLLLLASDGCRRSLPQPFRSPFTISSPPSGTSQPLSRLISPPSVLNLDLISLKSDPSSLTSDSNVKPNGAISEGGQVAEISRYLPPNLLLLFHSSSSESLLL